VVVVVAMVVVGGKGGKVCVGFVLRTPMHIVAIDSPISSVWCGHTCFYVADRCIWRVQLPRGKPVKLIAISTICINLASNDRFVYARSNTPPRLILFMRDGTILHDDASGAYCAQLTARGLVLHDKNANTIITYPGGQSYDTDSSVRSLSTSDTVMNTPVFFMRGPQIGADYHTYVNGVVLPVRNMAWIRVPRKCLAYKMHPDGIYVRDCYKAGLLALRRSGLPLALCWHIMNY
jgi:hypothetical protein